MIKKFILALIIITILASTTYIAIANTGIKTMFSIKEPKSTVGLSPIVEMKKEERKVVEGLNELTSSPENGYKPEEITEMSKNALKVNKIKEPIFKSNEDIPDTKMIDIKKKINIDRLKAENAELINAKIIKFEDYCKLNNKKTDENPDVSPKRKVWVVEMKKASGVEIPDQVNDGKLVIKNAKIIEVYDAESGQFLENIIKSN